MSRRKVQLFCRLIPTPVKEKNKFDDPYNRSCDELHQSLAWKGYHEQFTFGLRHKDICPLLKQWRLVKKGRAEKTPEFRLQMLQFLRKSLDVVPMTVSWGEEMAWSEDFRRYVKD